MDVARVLFQPLKCIFGDPAYLIPPLLPALVGMASTIYSPPNRETLYISITIQMVLGLLSSTILTDMAQRGYHNQPTSLLASIGRGLIKFPTALVASLLVAAAAMVGFVLLVVPGILVLTLTFFTVQEVVLADKGVIGSIKGSVDIVKGNFLFILALFLYLTSLTMLLEALAATVSPFASFVVIMLVSPYVTLAITFCYLEIKKEAVTTPPPM